VSARSDPKTQKSLTLGEIESDSREQSVNAEPSMKRMLFGITIVFNPEEENVNSSIRCNFDLASNEIDESEWQHEKHDLHKCVTDDRIIIAFNPE
jgi:hypothetical protein